jgi:hypothetical protein
MYYAVIQSVKVRSIVCQPQQCYPDLGSWFWLVTTEFSGFWLTGLNINNRWKAHSPCGCLSTLDMALCTCLDALMAHVVSHVLVRASCMYINTKVIACLDVYQTALRRRRMPKHACLQIIIYIYIYIYIYKDEMFSSKIYHNSQTACKQKTLPATAGFQTCDRAFLLLNQRSTNWATRSDRFKTGNY